MAPRHPSSAENADPALVLAIRYEIEQALSPVITEIREMRLDTGLRLAKGDTTLALHDSRITNVEGQCARHHALTPKTDRTSKTPNPYLMMVLSGVLGSCGSVAALWFLIGIGHQAAKGSP